MYDYWFNQNLEIKLYMEISWWTGTYITGWVIFSYQNLRSLLTHSLEQTNTNQPYDVLRVEECIVAGVLQARMVRTPKLEYFKKCTGVYIVHFDQ